MPKWFFTSVEITGGFLAGLNLDFPQGLTCIIGPRGSGKTTLAELLRYGIGGPNAASKAGAALLQGPTAPSLITLHTHSEGGGYIVKRATRQAAMLSTSAGQPITTVDLDRGTFLPLDGFNSIEIEAIADESIGAKRRTLLDDLRSEQLRPIHASIADKRRSLDANADQLRNTRQWIGDLTEQIEEMGDARAKLVSLPPETDGDETGSMADAARQQRDNEIEARYSEKMLELLADYRLRITDDAKRRRQDLGQEWSLPTSANQEVLAEVSGALQAMLKEVEICEMQTIAVMERVEDDLQSLYAQIRQAHASQKSVYATLHEQNLVASEAIQHRSNAERAVAHLEDLGAQLRDANNEMNRLVEERKFLKSAYLLERDRIASLRDEVAEELQKQAGNSVRIRVMHGADDFTLRQKLIEGLRGAAVRNREEIIEGLLRLRPEQLGQMISENDIDEFECQMSLGLERSRKVLDAFRASIDPLALEIIEVEDRICIELNVAPSASSLSTPPDPIFKDAAELSRGQKCTALLPLLLARRDTPLIIDQPEDNLDNHFVYETVVETVRRLKSHRQMIFITHNANIPVLAEADLVIVMNSDGKSGFVQKRGSLNECRDEIIDFLEGGREAFELRRQRYAE